MNKRTYVFIDTTGHIPNIPGEFHAGQEVDVDDDTNTVLSVRLIPEQTPQVNVTVAVDGNIVAKAKGELKKE